MEEKGLKIAYEVAEAEFDIFALAWDLDTEVETMTEEDSEEYATAKRKIVRQIVGGRLSVNEDGNLVYTLFEPVGSLTKLTIKRPRGAAYVRMDKAKEGKTITKFIHLMSAATGQISTIFSRMDGVDMKFLQAVYSLFLGS